KAPAITRERLYLETMKEIMAASSKVMIDADVGNNMLYLPLDQLMNQVAGASNSGASSGSSAGANAPSTQAAAGAQAANGSANSPTGRRGTAPSSLDSLMVSPYSR